MSDLTLDSTTTALVLIDLQRGIVGGDLAPNSAKDVVTKGAALAAAFRGRNALVVLVRVDIGLMPRPTADKPRPAMTPPPEFSELVPELNRQPSDVVVTKHQPNAFYCTDLDVHLRRRGIRTIVLGGVSTNIGVESTARAAFERGYDQIFVSDTMTARAAELHTHPVTHFFPTIGRVCLAQDVISAFDAR